MTNRYVLLRIISAFYKLLALLAFAMTAGAVFLQVTGRLQQTGLQGDVVGTAADTIAGALGIVLVGFVLMISFYALAQLIDIAISTNDSIRAIARVLEKSDVQSNLPKGYLKGAVNQ